jgi:hypothetical protein
LIIRAPAVHIQNYEIKTIEIFPQNNHLENILDEDADSLNEDKENLSHTSRSTQILDGAKEEKQEEVLDRQESIRQSRSGLLQKIMNFFGTDKNNDSQSNRTELHRKQRFSNSSRSQSILKNDPDYIIQKHKRENMEYQEYLLWNILDSFKNYDTEENSSVSSEEDKREEKPLKHAEQSTVEEELLYVTWKNHFEIAQAYNDNYPFLAFRKSIMKIIA